MPELHDIVDGVFPVRLWKRGKFRKLSKMLWLVGAVILFAGFRLNMVFKHVVGTRNDLTVALIGLGVALTVTGLMCLAPTAKEARLSLLRQYRIQLLSMAGRFERKSSIPGTDYGNFLILLERGVKQNVLAHDKRDRIIKALKDLIIEKGWRISGLDYVELEKELLRAGTIAVNDKNVQVLVEVLSGNQRQKILNDYERLREETRDRSLINP